MVVICPGCNVTLSCAYTSYPIDPFVARVLPASFVGVVACGRRIDLASLNNPVLMAAYCYSVGAVDTQTLDVVFGIHIQGRR
jgi:hypothetical protein